MSFFELKSFTGRMTRPRRTQVKRSLDRAAQLSPAEWNLVVPIDPTPEELEWFTNNTSATGFTCQWLGRTWLEGNFAQFPDIARYYLEDSNKEVVDALRELAREQAALVRGAPDSIDRLQELTSRLNQLDPQYVFGLSSMPDGSVEVSIWPRYEGAFEDRPIAAQASLRFPLTVEGKTAARAFQDALDYGAPATISADHIRSFTLDLPAGLTYAMEPNELRMQPASAELQPAVVFDARVSDEFGTTVAQLPLNVDERSRGSKGGRVVLRDSARVLTITLQVNAEQYVVQSRYQFDLPPSALPSAIIPAARFISEIREGNRIAFIHNGVQVMEAPIPKTADENALNYVHFMTDLDDIQRTTGVYFPVPSQISEDDMFAVWFTKRLLAGETMSQRWSSITITMDASAARALQDRGDDQMKDLLIEAAQTLPLGSYDIPIGRVRRIIKSFVIQEWPDGLAELPDDTPIELTLRPRDDDKVEVTMASP
jgi:hypothetical protein